MRTIIALSLILMAVNPAYAQTDLSVAATPVPGQGANGDWAFLQRYRTANAEVKSRPTRPKVVFMGDSITEMWANEPFIRDNGDFVGRGISAQTASQMLVRFRSDVIDLKPDVVHIMAGTNNVAQNNGPESPAESLGYIVSMVELARANGIKVILASIPPASDFWWRRGLEPASKIRQLNEMIREYANKHDILYVDYWSALTTADGSMKAEYAEDGVHPNPTGYGVMQPLAEGSIRRTLRGR